MLSACVTLYLSQGEQQPVTEDQKENVLWTDRFDRFRGKRVIWTCCLGFNTSDTYLQLMNSIGILPMNSILLIEDMALSTLTLSASNGRVQAGLQRRAHGAGWPSAAVGQGWAWASDIKVNHWACHCVSMNEVFSEPMVWILDPDHSLGSEYCCQLLPYCCFFLAGHTL